MTDQDKPAFAAALNQLAFALRAGEMDAHQMRTYFTALSGLEIELVIAAAEHLTRTAQWFPKTSEWIEAAIGIRHQRVLEQRETIRKRGLLGEPLCVGCDDTGWAPVEENGVRKVKRCACQDQRYLEIIGRRPLPQLPAAVIE